MRVRIVWCDRRGKGGQVGSRLDLDKIEYITFLYFFPFFLD